ncbi:hypothetical protein PSBY109024_19855 [Pseudoalteromonas byunsanensis]
MAKMGTFGLDDFQAIKSEEIRVKISIPDGFVLAPEKSWVGVDINSSAGTHYGEFKLTELLPPQASQESSFLTKKKVIVYSLRFDQTSELEFNKLQDFLFNRTADDIAIRVVPKLQSYPDTAESIEVSIDLQLSAGEGYFTLVDKAELSLDKLRQRKGS